VLRKIKKGEKINNIIIDLERLLCLTIKMYKLDLKNLFSNIIRVDRLGRFFYKCFKKYGQAYFKNYN
jgi:hypothetical protein